MKIKNMGKAALQILKGIAPLAASAIGGPFAGPALAIISKITGVGEDKLDDFILSASPEQLLTLKTAEMEFEKWRLEAGIKIEEIEQRDRESARALGRERGLGVQAVLTFLFIVGYFAMVFWFITKDMPESSEFAKGQLGVLIGILTAAIPQILAYWFGSSKGSRDKTDLMAKNGVASP